MIQVLQNTHSNDMNALRQELLQAGSDELLTTLDRWSKGKPKTESPNTPAPEELARRREQLLFDIAGQYTSNSRAKTEIARQLDQEFAGLPDQIAVAVLDDLRSDLWGALPDPDPGTSITSTLEERMVRQLSAAGIPVSRLTPRAAVASAEQHTPLSRAIASPGPCHARTDPGATDAASRAAARRFQRARMRHTPTSDNVRYV